MAATTDKKIEPFTLGRTSAKVFEFIAENPGSTARSVREAGFGSDIGHTRSMLITLRSKGVLTCETIDGRTKAYSVVPGAVEALEAGVTIAKLKRESRGLAVEPVDPMPEDQFGPAFRAVARFDALIVRYTGMLNRDRKDSNGEVPERTFILEGEEFVGTAQDLVQELRARRASIAKSPEFKRALKDELSVVCALQTVGVEPATEEAE